MRRVQFLAASAVALGLALSVSAAFGATGVVKRGTPVPLVLKKSLSTRTARVGQAVGLTTHGPLTLAGRVIVPTGTPVPGTITKVVKPSGFGKNARVYVALGSLRSTTGSTIALSTLKTPKKFKGDTGGAAAGAGLLVLGPVGAVGGIFVKGSEMTFAADRPFNAYVASDTSVLLPQR
jgi:hypothetical protein